MIISASRRTDIPAFYSKWFFQRIKEGFVMVRNPMNYHQVSRISLTPEAVDCFVFWTKNPKNMLSSLHLLENYNYYFHYTLNPYPNDIEKYLPELSSRINTFKNLAEHIGNKRVIWRYDPILLSDEIDLNYHFQSFEKIAKCLSGYTCRCVISFIDMYKKIQKDMKESSIKQPEIQEMEIIAQKFVDIGDFYRIEIQTCSESINLSRLRIHKSKCIDNELIEEISGYKLIYRKDKNQRSECGCMESVDIGEYNTCLHNCIYCYANQSHNLRLERHKMHIQDSPLLIGKIQEGDIIKERAIRSFKIKF